MDSREQTQEEQMKRMLKEAENKRFWNLLGSSLFMLLFLGSIVGVFRYRDTQRKDHLNVVVENKDGKLLVEDINTKEQRIVKLWDGLASEKDQLYIFPGDTINVRQKEDVYKQGKIINANNAHVDVNKDSLYIRKQRALFNVEKQQMIKQR